MLNVMTRLAPVVVLLEVVVDVWGVVEGLLNPARLTVPGGVIRALLMGALGYVFIVRRRSWARLSFAAIELVTGLTGLGFAAAAIHAGRQQLDATIVVLVCGYLTAGLIVAFAGMPPAGQSSVPAVAEAERH